MKRALPLTGSFILILAAVTCTFGALITGFAFTVNEGALALAWLIAAIALSVFSLVRKGKGVLALLPPALALFLWKLPEVVAGAKGVVCYITSEFNKWLFVPVFFRGAEATVSETTAFFAAAGVLLAFLLYAAICLWRNSALVVVLTAPIIFLTFVLIYNQPEPWYLVGLLAVYVTLIIFNALNRGGGSKRLTGIFTSFACAALLLGIAYFAVSPENYMRDERIMRLDAEIRDFAQGIGVGRLKSGTGWPAMLPGAVWKFDADRVGVADAGVRTILDSKVLEVAASKAGTYYLRGYSMQHFDGRSWSVNSDSLGYPDEYNARLMPLAIQRAYNYLYPDNEFRNVTMVISETAAVRQSPDIVYTPYYVIPYENAENRYWYEFFHAEESVLELVKAVPANELNRARYLTGYNSWARTGDTYIQINEETAAKLRKLALDAGVDLRNDRETIAEAVAAYIAQAGRYTLSPYVTPEGEDFALYFLEKSKQGYCIHFATVATLMLRALDIPARLTVGFVFEVPPGNEGQVISITDRSAHAWVEVYYNDTGWLPLEVTPPAPRGSGGTGGYYIAASTDYPYYPDHLYEDDMMPDWMLDQLMADRPPARPGDAAAVETPQPKNGSAFLRVFVPAAVFLLLAAAALLLHRKFARERRERRFRQEDTNMAVVHIWRYITRLTRQKPPQNEYEAMALRARFSQHRISEDDRGRMLVYSTALTADYYEHNSAFRRAWLKWGLAISS